MTKDEHWSVTVTRNGENLVTIESNCLSGKPEFTETEAQVIRDAAEHLKAFIGPPRETGACPFCRREAATGWHLCCAAEPPFTGLGDGPERSIVEHR